MKNELIDDLYNLLNNEIYKNTFLSVLESKNIYKNEYFSVLTKDDVLNLFDAYIIHEYINLETSDEMLVFLKSLQYDFIVESVLSDLIKLVVSSAKTDKDIKNDLINDVNEIRKLKNYLTKDYYKLLDKYNEIILDIISEEERIMKYKYKVDVGVLITLVKCEIVRQMCDEDNPYVIMDILDNNKEELEIIIINVFDTYINGIKTFNERRLKSKIDLDNLRDIIVISNDLGFIR